MTWDVRSNSGQIVTTLTGLASALFTTREEAAKQLLSDAALVEAAPPGLLAEVKAAVKPGDGTPPPIDTGSFVSFSGGKGRVDLIVKKGKVPGVEGDVEATDDSPAARVVVWKDGKATREKIAASTHTLKRIAPLDKPEKKDAASALVAAVARQDDRVTELGLPEHRRVTGQAVKAVYDRGVAAWPGPLRTHLSRTDWALGRVEHFVKVVNGDVTTKAAAGHDLDLLHKAHPMVAGETISLSMDDVDEQVRALLTD